MKTMLSVGRLNKLYPTIERNKAMSSGAPAIYKLTILNHANEDQNVSFTRRL